MTEPGCFIVSSIPDFVLTGDGTAEPWNTVPWLVMPRVTGEARFLTRCKLGRSATGLYLLADCADDRLDCSLTCDGADLFTEDVVEWFLQPDPSMPLYLEYEISPLGHHLVLLVPNHRGRFHGWTGWKMDQDRSIRREVRVRGGPQLPGATVSGWCAEVFLPWDLFRGFPNVPPESPWHGNVYRIDRDSKWALGTATGGDFHDYERFARFTFPLAD